jgi:hypothetical protein
MVEVGVTASTVKMTVGAEAVTVRGWNPAQAHALENRARSEQSQAHCGGFVWVSPRLEGPPAAPAADVVAVVVTAVVVITVVKSVDTTTAVLVMV